MQTVWVVTSSHGSPIRAYSTEDKARRAADLTDNCFFMPLVVDETTWVVRDTVAEKDLAVYADKEGAYQHLARFRLIERTVT